jgi:hypothetical protein
VGGVPKRRAARAVRPTRLRRSPPLSSSWSPCFRADQDTRSEAQAVQDLPEDWAVGRGGTGGLSEHLVAAGALQRVDLQVRLLVAGGDAGVAEQLAHARGRSHNPATPAVVRR